MVQSPLNGKTQKTDPYEPVQVVTSFLKAVIDRFSMTLDVRSYSYQGYLALPVAAPDWARPLPSNSNESLSEVLRASQVLAQMRQIVGVERGIALREVARLNTRERLTATWFERRADGPIAFTHKLWRMILKEDTSEELGKALLALINSKVTSYLVNLFSANNDVGKDDLGHMPIPDPQAMPVAQLATLADALLSERSCLEQEFAIKYRARPICTIVPASRMSRQILIGYNTNKLQAQTIIDDWEKRKATMKYAFVIDQRKCIGCHACTVACKAEHDVPIGVYRTWVKYIEKGEFPNSRRYFLVNRCNHCDDAPCVAICPTKALYKRADGIVDFDSSRCIGCKSCMQACPYDALYIDPNSHTAAKCNYCAHRTEVGMEPACVVVCPERAIIAGDMHNPNSEIARIIAREPVRVRKPEQGTKPKVYYVGAEEAAINPEAAVEELPNMTMWSTILKPHHEDESAIDGGTSLRRPPTINPLNPLKPYQPLEVERDPAAAHIVYDTPKNSAPWGSKVSAYLATKSIGAGVMMVAALALALYGLNGNINGTMNALLGIGAPVIGGLFIAITLVLLIADLKRPDRAIFLVTKANPTSWLVWGGYILGIFGLIEAAWFVAALIGLSDVLRWLLMPAAPFGAAAAGYSAFLFGQAEGRDFWQSPLMLPVLLVQATLAGAASLGLLAWVLNVSSTLSNFFTVVLLLAVALHVLLVMIEVFGAHANSHVAAAAHFMAHGGLKDTFWGPFFAVGSLIPLILLVIALFAPAAQPALLGSAGILALAGLFVYEHCFVVAGQVVPLS